MTYYKATEQDFESVADAIREKTGRSAKLEFPTEFVSEIGSISGGGTEGVTFDTKPPTNQQGSDGDYWYLVSIGDIAPVFTPNITANSAISAGIVISVENELKISGIAMYARTDTVFVHLSTMDGVEIAGFNNVPALVSSWNEYYFDDPITLYPNEQYVVWGSNINNYAMSYTQQSMYPAHGVSYVKGCYATSENTYPTGYENGTKYGAAVIVDNGGIKFVTKQWYKENGVWVRLDG